MGVATLALAVELGACSASSDKSDSGLAPSLGTGDGSGAKGSVASGGTSNQGSQGPGSGGSTNIGGTSGTGGEVVEMPPPPEQELESAFQAPVATDRYVWTANPTSGRVALIDATDFSVRLADAGVEPTTVAALPGGKGEDAAIVLNAGSDDATILRLGADGAVESTTVKTHSGANAVAVSPSGKWAIAWTNAALLDASTLDPTDGLQDISVIGLDGEPQTTILSVGYRPSQITFDAKEKRAFVVTEPGLTVVELGGDPAPVNLVDLTDDPVAVPAARDVSVTPDGKYAVVRIDGQKTLGVVDLATGERQAIELGDFVTDMDLAADGTQAFAVAGGELVVVPIPPGDADPQSFARASATGEVARSVTLSPDASLALLYSNATEDPYLGILSAGGDWSSYEGRAVDLRAPVQAVFAAPDAKHGIAFQTTASGSSKAGAFSVVSAQYDRAPKIVGTDAPPISLAFSPDGGEAVITTRDLTKQNYGTYLVHLETLEQSFVKLSSPPLAAGIVPSAHVAFVAQAHPEGRVTFVDLGDGSPHTLTGFELSAKVTQ